MKKIRAINILTSSDGDISIMCFDEDGKIDELSGSLILRWAQEAKTLGFSCSESRIFCSHTPKNLTIKTNEEKFEIISKR